jgi:hypothetical protein
VKNARLLPTAAALAAIAAVVGIAIAREFSLGAEAVASADAAIGRLDWAVAIDESRAAAESRAPWSPWPERGAARLENIARAAEARGDSGTALVAYGALRSASLATQGPGAGGAAWSNVADEGLARAAAASDDSARSRDTVNAMLRDLQRPNKPGLGSIESLAFAAVAVFTALGSIATGRRIIWGRALLVAGFVVFAIALLLN